MPTGLICTQSESEPGKREEAPARAMRQPLQHKSACQLLPCKIHKCSGCDHQRSAPVQHGAPEKELVAAIECCDDVNAAPHDSARKFRLLAASTRDDIAIALDCVSSPCRSASETFETPAVASDHVADHHSAVSAAQRDESAARRCANRRTPSRRCTETTSCNEVIIIDDVVRRNSAHDKDRSSGRKAPLQDQTGVQVLCVMRATNCSGCSPK